MERLFFSFFIFLFLPLLSFGQEVVLKGRVYDLISNESIPFANVFVQNINVGTQTDDNGVFVINNLKSGLYNVQVSFVGYKTKVLYEVSVNAVRPAILDIGLETSEEELTTVEVKAKPFSKTDESPLSLRSIGIDEIKRNPGGNRDISKVVQSLPGVASTPTFRNDILIRGGAPSENRFFIDGIEIPVINHFSTQGSSGGPVGLINVDFVRGVDFYSGAFPVARGNALSSVFDFQFKDGNPDRILFTGVIGASDMGVFLEGPLGKKTNFLFSARRSYLQLLFKALELPFLPVYNDVNVKVKYKINDKNVLTVLGVGALDDFSLNTIANKTESQRFLLEQLPINDQWNYTSGLKFTHFNENSYFNIIASRSSLNNRAYKYEQNDESDESKKVLDYRSVETENKLRFEQVWRKKGYKIIGGLGYEYALYNNNTFFRRIVGGNSVVALYDSELGMNKWYGFGQVSKNFIKDKLVLSAGFRTDGNDYNNNMKNLLTHLSPRFSASYSFDKSVSLNFNTGIYYQLPAYTSLGYQENGVFVNQNESVDYIRCSHLIGGLEYNLPNNMKVGVEGFYKGYNNYPFLLRDSVSLANFGGDFGVIGDEQISSESEGRSYGLELLVHQKLWRGFYGIIAYTFSYSEFLDKNGVYVPSTWDNRHVVSLTGGKRFGKNWEIGAKWRFYSGAPFTPYDLSLSSLKSVWAISPGGVLDYDKLNGERAPSFHSLDLRVDKKWFFKRWNLNLYLDIQNLYGAAAIQRTQINVVYDEVSGLPITDPTDSERYLLKELAPSSGTSIPSVGIVVEF